MKSDNPVVTGLKSGVFKSSEQYEPDKLLHTSIVEYSKDSVHIHPTQKPFGLIANLIKTYTNKGDVVLDNVAGSGTIPKAAKDLGRDYIAIEQSEKYCKMIVDRLNNRLDIKDYD